MRFSRSTILAALWTSSTLVDAVADGTNYEIDAYSNECGTNTINTFKGIADANGATSCLTFAAPSLCFTTSVGPDVKGGCLFVLAGTSDCTNSTTAASSNNAGQTQNVTASGPTNSVKIVCQPNPT
ncbi:hypothetical protein M409DRAFT_24016 [Zasmidium cellare ATCC 36951]|uniref:Uncharacterized protein n=1 Tax=Zasmidium cellare ATCC 36951 TaxID=1080233 RepID=A0A6A6CHR7_ZASCE|nr:uncharacterized protein M409DRAFT_24016 [Zasmidium cellare ATCC 36951]KAF2165728.1 hypothetical protein M409DRAFT_24016 [Zasmidium cellare ATCC 36951]